MLRIFYPCALPAYLDLGSSSQPLTQDRRDFPPEPPTGSREAAPCRFQGASSNMRVEDGEEGETINMVNQGGGSRGGRSNRHFACQCIRDCSNETTKQATLPDSLVDQTQINHERSRVTTSVWSLSLLQTRRKQRRVTLHSQEGRGRERKK